MSLFESAFHTLFRPWRAGAAPQLLNAAPGPEHHPTADLVDGEPRSEAEEDAAIQLAHSYFAAP